MTRRSLYRVALASLAVLAAALTVAVRAPAAWVGDWLQRHSTLRLLDARGTVWDGSAMLALSDGRQAVVVPGRLSWRIGLASLAPARVSAQLAHPWLEAPLSISLRAGAIALNAGSAQLPAGALTALGMPFNTVRPGGLLSLRWTDMELHAGGFAGELQVDWRDAQSALSTVAPLGSYRLHLAGTGGAARLQLVTLSGPLRLQGEGVMKAGRVSFRGLASAEPEFRAALNGLLGVLGPRSGDNALLALET